MTATYSFTLTEAERQDMARAFGLLVEKLTNAQVLIEGNASSGRATGGQSSPLPPSPPAVAPPSTIELRARWARAKGNKEVTNQPADAECVERDISKLERADSEGRPRLKVTWPAPNVVGFVTASCWDEKLFPFFAARIHQKTV